MFFSWISPQLDIRPRVKFNLLNKSYSTLIVKDTQKVWFVKLRGNYCQPKEGRVNLHQSPLYAAKTLPHRSTAAYYIPSLSGFLQDFPAFLDSLDGFLNAKGIPKIKPLFFKPFEEPDQGRFFQIVLF